MDASREAGAGVLRFFLVVVSGSTSRAGGGLLRAVSFFSRTGCLFSGLRGERGIVERARDALNGGNEEEDAKLPRVF